MAYISKSNTTAGIKPIGSNLYGTCSTGASTAAKVVSMPDFDVLVVGVTIHVQFTNGNVVSNPTLAVGSTEAKAIKRNGSLEGEWQAGSVISFTYDGTNWVQNDADINGASYGLSYDEDTNTLSIVEDGGSASVILEDAVTYTLSISGHTVTLTGSNGSTSSVTVPDNDTKYGISISGNTLSLVEGGSGTSVSIPDNDTTYDLSISGNTLTLTGSDGTTDDVTLPDNDTKYGLSISGHTISLVEGGSTTQVTVPDANTTYSISISGNVITLTGSDGSTSTVTVSATDTTYSLSKSGNTITLTGSDGTTTSVTDENTTYELSISGHTVTLTGSDGSTDSVTVPDDNTTYTLSISGHTITLTPSSGSAQSVTVPDNNTTYTISNNGSTITLTPSSGSAQSITVPNDNTTYSFSLSGHTLTITPSSGTAQTITLPDTNTTYTISISGNVITLTPSSGTAQTITIPLATTATDGLLSAADKTKLDSISLDGTISFYRKIESYYETDTVPASTIPIGIANYSSADILLVDINGLDLVEGLDYTISGTNIVLTVPIEYTDQIVHFVALRAVNASSSDYSALKGDAGVVDAWPRSGATPLSANWLSETSGGSALTPEANQIYILMADSGDYTANTMFRWNGTAYEPLTSGGGGDGGHVELTQAEYDALTPEEKTDGTVYFITDGEPETYIVNDSVPIGAIQAYGGASAPNGWLICDGSAVSRTTYSELFSAIGTTYGSGDGSTTFNLPDLKGRVIVGVGESSATGHTNHTLGQKSGEEKHTLTVDEMPSHSHNVLSQNFNVMTTNYTPSSGDRAAMFYGSGANNQTGSRGGGQAHNLMQPYVVTNYIIKAKDYSLLQANLLPILDMFYPVGSYYETADSSFDPEANWGGTWVLENGVIEEKTLLWTNPNPTTSTTSLSNVATVSDYDYADVEFSRQGMRETIRIATANISTGYIYPKWSNYFAIRSMSISNGELSFGNGGYYGSYNAGSMSANGGYAIPYKVYGIKLKSRWHRTA